MRQKSNAKPGKWANAGAYLENGTSGQVSECFAPLDSRGHTDDVAMAPGHVTGLIRARSVGYRVVPFGHDCLL